MKRVAIYGIFGLYNYGCEAIVRGTVDFARRLYGEECPIVYYSRNYQDDKKTADELGIDGGKKNMGKLMGAVMKKVKGLADGNDVRKIIEEFLSE